MALISDSGGGDERVMADINVTPLVDVMLVLLIIFMVTAPMLHQGIEVALPKVEAENLPQRVDDPIVLTMTRNKLIYIRETPVHQTELVDRLLPLLQTRGDQSVLLKADRDLPYGEIMDLLTLLNRGGITNVGMVTERRSSRR
jgi:biopolymer transport protein TolR